MSAFHLEIEILTTSVNCGLHCLFEEDLRELNGGITHALIPVVDGGGWSIGDMIPPIAP